MWRFASTIAPSWHFVPGATEPIGVQPLPSALHIENFLPPTVHLRALGVHLSVETTFCTWARTIAPSLQVVPGATLPTNADSKSVVGQT